MSLESRHALVCGASAGIGRAAALALASLGARVTVLARRRELLESLLPELRQAGAPEAGVLVADLDDRAALRQQMESCLARHGAVHILVNNSGGPPPGPALEASDAEFETAFGRIVLAARLLVRLVLPGMRDAGFGRIVNVLSTSVREPIADLGAGNTMRGAMAAWTKTVAGELPPGITINNVLPGATATQRLHALAAVRGARTGASADDVEAAWGRETPEGRIADPSEIAAAIAFLATPAASYIRGVSLAVDGGRMRSI
jgi:3-oxoacyl-[acyl-carrier protein] reductase